MPRKPKPIKQNTIAMVYDFDGTLSPQPMQEYTVLPKIGVEPALFWQRVNAEARATASDQMLVYMRHIVEQLDRKALGREIRWHEAVGGQGHDVAVRIHQLEVGVEHQHGGQLMAWDPAQGRPREFAVHRVTSVMSADEG